MDSPHTLVQPRATELVLGRYHLEEQLGKGGFGVVWRARDALLHRHVALKRIPLGAGGGPIDRERASREALATARLAHPAIVALHEACVQDGSCYLISELVHGDTLAVLIAEDALEDEEIVEIGAALASALIHAHARGVIHRDIKPQNVLVPHPPADGADSPQTPLAAAKLTDFGGASLVGEEALTRTGDVLGTLAYMSPEQSEGRKAGPQSDLYSLALVIYEALCGVNPVRGGTPAATARRIGQPLPPLARARRDLPAPLTRALDRALAPVPERRGSLEELRRTFEQALERGLRQRRWPTQRFPAQPDRVAAVDDCAAAADDGRTAVDGRAPADRPERARRLALPRAAWLACGLMLAAWQLADGRAGVALLVIAALVPALALSGRRSGAGWLACALAPALGYIGLAGAFPALAGQAARWRERAALAALGFWWLRLAAPLADPGRSAGVNLWLAAGASSPTRAAWEGSLSLTATHIIAPLLTVGVLLGALSWALAAAALPWLVRGRSAVRDLVAVSVWATALAAAAPVLDAGLRARAPHPDPRGAVLGAIVGSLAAVAARALRGPV